MFTNVGLQHGCVCLALTFAIGCSESLSPNATRELVLEKTLSSYRDSYGNITLADEAGTRFTFNVSSREVRTSGGEILHLEPDQADLVEATFLNTIETDAVANGLASIAGVPDDGQCTPEERDAGICDGAQTLRTERHLLVTRLDPTRRRNVSPLVRRQQATFARPGHRALNTLSLSGDVCTNIAQSAFDASDQYRSVRTSWISIVLQLARAEVIGGVVKKVIDHGSGAAMQLAERTAGHYYAAITAGFLAGLWNDYSCRSRTLTVGTRYRSLGPGLDAHSASGGTFAGYGPGGTVCFLERGWISFNGGADWYSVQIKTCYDES